MAIDRVFKVLLPIGAVLVAVVACDSDKSRCGVGSAPCPPPTAGLAIVQGSVVNAAGIPQPDRQVYVSCPVAGAYGQRTKSDGTFRITIVYGSREGPPPLDPDG